MMSKPKSKSQENLELPPNVASIRKGLDGPVVEYEDWLTPLNPGDEFVVSPGYAPNTYLGTAVFLDFYRKVCNYNHCIFLIEERNGEEIPRYVLPKAFCQKYKLVEVLYNG